MSSATQYEVSEIVDAESIKKKPKHTYLADRIIELVNYVINKFVDKTKTNQLTFSCKTETLIICKDLTNNSVLYYRTRKLLTLHSSHLSLEPFNWQLLPSNARLNNGVRAAN